MADRAAGFTRTSDGGGSFASSRMLALAGVICLVIAAVDFTFSNAIAKLQGEAVSLAPTVIGIFLASIGVGLIAYSILPAGSKPARTQQAAGYAPSGTAGGPHPGSPPSQTPPPLPLPSSFLLCSTCGLHSPPGSPRCYCGNPLTGVALETQPDRTARASGSRNFLWPSVEDLASARKAAKGAAIAAFFVAGATALSAALAVSGLPLVPGIGPSAFLDAVLFLGLGLAIWLGNSRVAATVALVLYLVERLAMWGQWPAGSYFMCFYVTVAFLGGVRGTFACHQHLSGGRREKVF